MRIVAWVIAAGFAVAAACSSGDGGGSGGAAGAGGGGGPAGAGGGPAGQAGDASATDAPADGKPDQGSAPSCPAGSWATDIAETECNLLKQDCPGDGLCVPKSDNGQCTTRCALTQPGFAGAGQKCKSLDDCDRGLFCVLGYCTKPCCQEDQVKLCGKTGTCSINFIYTGGACQQASFRVCVYGKPCQPWTAGCDPGDACKVIVPQDGTAFCIPIRGGAPVPEGGACKYIDECGDSSLCSNGTCRYLCRRDTSGGPTDAGTVGGPPGQGGCPQGQSCKGAGNFPSWLGICGP